MKKIFIAVSVLLMLVGGVVGLHNSALAEGGQQKIIEKSKYSVVVRFRTMKGIELHNRYPLQDECFSDEKTEIRRIGEGDDAFEVKVCSAVYEVDEPVIFEGTGDSEKDFEKAQKIVEEKVNQQGGFKGFNQLPWIETHVLNTEYNNVEEGIIDGVKKPEDCEKYQTYDFYLEPIFGSYTWNT